MQSKKGPFILLSVLGLVLVFVVGVRYGQRVESTNKALSAILTSTPYAPSPTINPLQFATYNSKGCGAEFLYPSSIGVIKQSTTESRLTGKDGVAIALSCAKIPSFRSFFEDKNVATKEVSFQKQSQKALVKTTNGQTYLLLIVRNPFSGSQIFLAVEEKLYPLLQSSLIFKQPAAQE